MYLSYLVSEELEGDIFSPNYPQEYPNFCRDNCTQVITVPEGYNISLRFIDWEVSV